MPFTPRLALPPGLEVPRPVDPAGVAGPTAGQARGPRWHRVGKNAYRPVLADPPVEQRIFDAVGQLPACGAITGWAALRLHGAAYFDGRTVRAGGVVLHPVLIAAGRSSGSRAVDGVRFSYEPLAPDEVAVVHGLRVTTPMRALFDELRTRRDDRSALVAAEMAVAARVVRLPAMRDYAQAHRAWRRSLHAIAVLDRARPGARSPQEVELRQVCELDAGLPILGINVPIFDLDGRFLLEADLLEDTGGLVIEYDGDEHAGAGRRARDADRIELCGRVGLVYAAVVAPDLARPSTVVDRVRGAWGRSLHLPPDQRRWTTEWPPGWAPWW